MRIEIISEKGSGKINEDSFCASKNTFGVFDGAGSLTKFVDENQRTGGFIASHLVANIFAKEDKPLCDIAVEANSALKNAMTAKSIDTTQGVNRWSTTVSAVNINKNNFEWVSIGDSVIIAIKKDGTFEIVSPYHNHDVEVLQLVKGLSGKNIGNLWDYEPFLKASTILQNNRNITYGVLDGSEEAKKFIQNGKMPLEKIQSILLLTDGCYIPQENPDGNEDFAGIVKIFQEKGLTGLYNSVRQIQIEDPNLWKYPRFKQSDDFTAIAINFSLTPQNNK